MPRETTALTVPLRGNKIGSLKVSSYQFESKWLPGSFKEGS